MKAKKKKANRKRAPSPAPLSFEDLVDQLNADGPILTVPVPPGEDIRLLDREVNRQVGGLRVLDIIIHCRDFMSATGICEWLKNKSVNLPLSVIEHIVMDGRRLTADVPEDRYDDFF